MNKQAHFFLKTGLVVALSLTAVSMPVKATPLFPRALSISAGSFLVSPYIDSLSGDFNNDGKPDLATVYRGAGGGGALGSGGVLIFIGDGNGEFVQVGGFPAGDTTLSVASGDFNTDGNTDLVVANLIDNTLSIELGDGSGGFTATAGSPVSVGVSPADVLVADFNGDTHVDIAVANASDNTLSILLGDGSGGFSAATSSPATGQFPVAMVAGDVNADGKVDILVANKNDGTISVLLGSGAGGFISGTTLLAGSQPQALVLADFNADGKQDLAIADSGASSVSVLLGNGAGSFSLAGSPYTVGTKPIDIEVVDINGDGKLDIATSNVTANNVSVLLGDGSGGFGAVMNNVINGSPTSIILQDFDNDGRIDISTTNSDASMSLLLGQGSGEFTSDVKTVTIFDNPSSIATGDVNNDGKLDMVVASSGSSNNIQVLSNTGSGDFSNVLATLSVGATPAALSFLALADLDGDSILDLAVTNSNDNVVAVLKGNDIGSFVPVSGSPFTVGTDPEAIAVGDMNNDGKADLVVANKGSNSASLLQNTGAGSFSLVSNFPVGTDPVSVALVDQDNDSKLDIFTANRTADSLTFWPGGSSGGPIVPLQLTVGNAPVSVITGDLNGDAYPDRVVANRGDDTLTVTLGAVTLATETSRTVPVAGLPSSVVIGDFNGDTRPDIAVLTNGSRGFLGGASSDSLLYVFSGDGLGGFTLAPHYPATIVGSSHINFGGTDLKAGDFNGDGLTDLALINGDIPTLKVLLNLDPRPVAKTDSTTTNQNTSVTTGNVLGNDVDANQTGSLSISAVDTSSSHGGTITNNGDNTFTYLPAAGFTGTDTFNYTITDGWTKTAAGTVTVTVNAASASGGGAAPASVGGGGGGSFNFYLLMLLPGLIYFVRKH